jgi:hypothetical protein
MEQDIGKYPSRKSLDAASPLYSQPHSSLPGSRYQCVCKPGHRSRNGLGCQAGARSFADQTSTIPDTANDTIPYSQYIDRGLAFRMPMNSPTRAVAHSHRAGSSPCCLPDSSEINRLVWLRGAELLGVADDPPVGMTRDSYCRTKFLKTMPACHCCCDGTYHTHGSQSCCGGLMLLWVQSGWFEKMIILVCRRCCHCESEDSYEGQYGFGRQCTLLVTVSCGRTERCRTTIYVAM